MSFSVRRAVVAAFVILVAATLVSLWLAQHAGVAPVADGAIWGAAPDGAIWS